ncbi:hypothetical protein ACH41H_33845 [Streptomyces sp. NPDC020800]
MALKYLNVLDRADPLAFAVSPVFDGAEGPRLQHRGVVAYGAYTT